MNSEVEKDDDWRKVRRRWSSGKLLQVMRLKIVRFSSYNKLIMLDLLLRYDVAVMFLKSLMEFMQGILLLGSKARR